MNENCAHMSLVVSIIFEPAHVFLVLVAFSSNEGSGMHVQPRIDLCFSHMNENDSE